MTRVKAARACRGKTLHDKTIGIDVDRDMLVTCFYDRALQEHPVDEFPNTPEGFKVLVERCLIFAPGMVVLESTGQYHLAAYDAMRIAGLPVAVINPTTIKALLRVEEKVTVKTPLRWHESHHHYPSMVSAVVVVSDERPPLPQCAANSCHAATRSKQ